MKTIYCLFTVVNDYNQPKNNLLAWFSTQPTLDELMSILKDDLSKPSIVVLYANSHIKDSNCEYRIEEIKEKEYIK